MFKMSIPIKGWQKNSLIDYSPYTASVIFLGGCSFRCDYCHNPDLVLNFDKIPDIDANEIIDYLKSKKQWIDGVCITGGEPTIHKDLPLFISELKKIGMKVKLDTNGTNPSMIKELIDKKLIDYIAMDIKTILEDYEKVAAVHVDKEKIKESVSIIKNSSIDYEFRTTAIPGIVGKKEIFLIGRWLEGAERFCIQQFRADMPLINKELQKLKPYSKEELNKMAEAVKPFLKKVEVRG
jgi:pyruvate formate lyase activating enzyme